MPVTLESIQLKLAVRVRSLDNAFDRHILTPKISYRVDKFALQEGLISALWQVWCQFCRQTIISSVQGAQTTRGVVTTSKYSRHQEMEIAFIAKQLARNQPVKQIKPLAGSHLEPTWGDSRSLNRITTGLKSSNEPTLTSAFSSCSAINDLQLCRNSAAHICSQTLNEIRTRRVSFSESWVSHPSDMMLWVESNTKDFLWKSWVEEITLISELSIE